MEKNIAPVGRGGSRSQFLAPENGDKYVVKFKENPQGKRVLANELVASGLAMMLELPCPEGVLAELDERFIRISGVSRDFGQQISPGLHFGSRYLKDIYLKPPLEAIMKVRNKNVFPGIILFDILTMNCDRRNSGNYVIAQSNSNVSDFFIIDHGHCFGSPDWDTSIVNKIGTWNQNQLPQISQCINGDDPFRGYIEKIRSLDNNNLSQLIADIPEEWDISPDERMALETFIKGQVNHIEDIISQNKSLFPNWN